ncbi:MAG TPA: carbohydrate-binding family 9-like protein [Gemmataceae bacterium]|nr:carbohydrate-binding family 9-like protein [Gemmataceae bacterium]
MYQKAPYFILLIVALVAVAAVSGLLRSSKSNSPGDGAGLDYVPPRGYICYRASEPISIDGNLDKPVWQSIPWSEDFVDIEGDAKPKPRFRTRMKMAWDDQCLYIAAELEEPHVWATLTQHDSVIFHDNDFEVFLDPDGDNHMYGELELNALNTTWDLLLPIPYKDGGQAVNAWEIAGLKTAVKVNGTINDPSDSDKGWTVEIAWPWKGLKELTKVPVPPRDGEQWRINFSRVEWQHEIVAGKYRKVEGTKEDNWVWSPQGVVDMHRPEHWGYVQFSTAAPGKAEFHPDPAGPAREYLHRIYYAQVEYKKKNGRWARSLAELGLHGLKHESLFEPPDFQVTENQFEASVVVKMPEGKFQRWHIRSDSRIWSD